MASSSSWSHAARSCSIGPRGDSVSSRERELRAQRVAALEKQLSTAERELELAFPATEPLSASWNDEKASALFAKFVANRTWQTPTLVNFAVRGPALDGDASFWSDSNLAPMPKDWVDSWRPERNQFLAGVPRSEVPPTSRGSRRRTVRNSILCAECMPPASAFWQEPM